MASEKVTSNSILNMSEFNVADDQGKIYTLFLIEKTIPGHDFGTSLSLLANGEVVSMINENEFFFLRSGQKLFRQ